MKRLALLFCLSLASSTVLAQGFGGFLRSITGSLGGGASDRPATGRSSTIGIRGMDEAGAVTAAEPATEDVKLLETWASTRIEAEQAATRRGLSAKTATFADSSAAK